MSASIDNKDFRNLLYSWPEKAMAYLYEHYYHNLLRVADLYTRDRALSQDAVQEVFADVFRKHKKLGQLRAEPILTYLNKAVVNHSIGLYKKHLRANIRETVYYYRHEATAAEKNAENRIISSEKDCFLKVVIATLSPREKTCLLMQIEQNMPVKEIAQHLGITVKAVERNLTGARKRLKKFRTNLE